MAKVHPTVLEAMVPITHDAFDRQTSIELHAKRVQNQAKIRQEVGEGGLVYLIGISTFVDRHALAE